MARMQSAETTASTSAKTCFLTVSSSNTASMTKSASAKASLETEPVTRALVRLAASAAMRFLAEQLVHFGVDVAHALVHAGLVDVRHDHRHLELAGEEQGQLAGHQPGADHAHLGDRPGQLAVRGAGGALGALLHQVQERVHGGAELGGLHQPGQGFALQAGGLRLAHGPVGLHDVQHLGRRGRGVGGLGFHEGAAGGDGAGPAASPPGPEGSTADGRSGATSPEMTPAAQAIDCSTKSAGSNSASAMPSS